MKKIVELIMIIGILLGFVFAISQIKTESLQMPVKILVVKSSSMSPALNINDVVIIIKRSNYNVGDIVTYKDGDGVLITHRIIENVNQKFITKGDFNNSPDEKQVNTNNIIGKVVCIINLKVKIAIVILMNIAIIFYALVVKKGKKKKYEKDN